VFLWSLSQEVNEKLQLIGRELGRWHVSLEKQLHDDPMTLAEYSAVIKLYDEQILGHNEDEEWDLFELQKIFFDPLMLILSSQRHDPIVFEISTIIAECRHAIKGIKMEKKYLIENVTQIKERYQEQVLELNGVVGEVDKSVLL
jgi:hypothetical protein